MVGGAVALLVAAPGPAQAGSAAALDHLAGLRDAATGGLTAGAGVDLRGRRAQDAWAALAVAAAGEDPARWRIGAVTLRSGAGPRPARTRPIALARWTMAAVASGDLSTADRAAAGTDLEALTPAVPDATRTRPLVTAWTLLGLVALGDRPAAAARAAAALVVLQRPDGGWASGPGGASDTPATAAAVQALGALRRPEDAAARARARAWLAAAQRGDGGWGPVRGRGLSTGLDTAWAALAVWALGESPVAAPWTRRGDGPATLLRRRQNRDGGVADVPGGASVPVVTATAVMAWRGRPLPLAAAVLAAPPVRTPHLVRRDPAPGDAPRDLVSVVYADDSGGTGVDPAGVRLRAGTRDVTARARISAFSLQIPAAALGPLPTVLHLRVPDRAGNVLAVEWRVAAAARAD